MIGKRKSVLFFMSRAQWARDSPHLVSNPIQPFSSNRSSFSQTGNLATSTYYNLDTLQFPNLIKRNYILKRKTCSLTEAGADNS